MKCDFNTIENINSNIKDVNLFNTPENEKIIKECYLKIKNDDIANSVIKYWSNINWLDDIEITNKKWELIWEKNLNEVFNYFMDEYEFLVTVPVKYKNTVLEKWELKTVSPSDYSSRKWFVWTIWRHLLIPEDEERYIVKIKKTWTSWNYKFWWKTLYPRFTWENRSFKWVAYLNSQSNLKIWEDYEIIWIYNWKDFEKMINSQEENSYNVDTNKINNEINKEIEKIKNKTVKTLNT